MARPSKQKRAARMRAKVRRAALQKQTQSPQNTENQQTTKEEMQVTHEDEFHTPMDDGNHMPVGMSAQMLEVDSASENQLSHTSEQVMQFLNNAHVTGGVSVRATQYETESSDENEGLQFSTQITQPTNVAKEETRNEVSVLGRQRENHATNDKTQQHTNQQTDHSKYIKKETEATTQHETNLPINPPQTIKQETQPPTDTEETTERVSMLAKKRRRRPVPVQAPQPAPEPTPTYKFTSPPTLTYPKTQPTIANPRPLKAPKRKASEPAESIDLSSPKKLSPKKRKARIAPEIIDLSSTTPAPREHGQRPSPKNLRKRKPVDPPETIDLRSPIKRARILASTSPGRTRSYTKQAVHPPQTQAKPNEDSQKGKGGKRVEWADRDTRKQTTVACQDSTRIKKEDQPHRIRRDRSQMRKPAHSHADSHPKAQVKVKREPTSHSPENPSPENQTENATPFYTPLQQALLSQTQAVTNATYEVLERRLASTQATAAHRARTTLATETETDTETDTDIDTDIDAAHDPIPPLPLGRVLNVAKYLDTNVLSRLTQTCKTLYRKLTHELQLRQDTTSIPDSAWQTEIRLGLSDAEGRRTVEWLPGTGYYPGPMELATQHGRVDDVRAYLLKGADHNCLNAYGIRPLRWAVAMGQLGVVRLLLEDKADPNLPDEDGAGGALAGPFVGPGTETETFIETLLDAGARITCMDAFTNLCHSRKAAEYLKYAIANGSASASALGHLRGAAGTTVLHVAAQMGHKAIVNILLHDSEGVAIDAVNDHGQSPLHLALRDGNEATALALIDAGCALNLADNFNRDALALAIEKGYAEVVRAMLEAPPAAGVDFRATRKYGHRPSAEMTHLEGAFSFRRFGIMKLLLVGRVHVVDEVLQRRCRELARTDPTYGELCEDVSLLMGSSMLGFDSEEVQTEVGTEVGEE
ncbi:ankyrin [Aspergillus brunneoviolaceus CBS 621.78]|uniref:Ankyrin n=1 Tax=Aspergillus brunneoviolaceus CBS 621.78 TaxID=1450534 RepID=A0ACD1G7V6_9EURO|nr:ankyrin [Aspergillus brunneoviolaceus CBS 621.78]RAH45313.1 ankyrin [Aspergillus brunneoviolaceus CBS 621.78]